MSDTSFRTILLTVIVLLGTALYAHTLNFPFVFDDNHYLVFNPLFKDADYFWKLVNIRDFKQLHTLLKIDPDLTTNFILRPVSYLTFHGNYLLQELQPAGYRLVNIALHIANAALLYRCVAWLLTLSGAALTLTSSSTRFIAATTALLFLTHPLQTQAVTYIVQRFTSLATFFFLLTCYLYLRSRGTSDINRICTFRRLALLALIIGMLTKELLFTAPLMLLLMELVVFRESPLTAAERIWPYLLCLPLIPLVVITASQGDSSPAGGVLNVVNYNRYSSLSYLITQFSVVTTYLRLLLLPYGQNIDPDYPLYTSLLQIRPLLSLALLVSLGALAGAIYRARRHDPRSSLLLFGTAWFFVTIAIDSSIVPLPDLMVEQRIYLPSIGIFLGVASMTDLIRTGLPTAFSRRLLLMAMAVWGVTLCCLTYARNNVWRSEISIWQDAAEKSPHKARPWNALGIAYALHERYEEAVPCFQRTCRIYLDEGKYGRAAEACMKGITLNPANADLYHLLGTAYWELGQLTDAELVLRQAIDINPGNGNARLVLARVYHGLKQGKAAQEQLRAALQHAGHDPRLQQEIRQFAGAISGATK